MSHWINKEFFDESIYFRFLNSASLCAIRSWKQVFPRFFEEHRRAIDHFNVLAKRYSFLALSSASMTVCIDQSPLCGLHAYAIGHYIVHMPLEKFLDLMLIFASKKIHIFQLSG